MRKPNDPFISNNCYHVFNRAVGNEKMFREAANYVYFLQKLRVHILPVVEVFCRIANLTIPYYLSKISEASSPRPYYFIACNPT